MDNRTNHLITDLSISEERYYSVYLRKSANGQYIPPSEESGAYHYAITDSRELFLRLNCVINSLNYLFTNGKLSMNRIKHSTDKAENLIDT